MDKPVDHCTFSQILELNWKFSTLIFKHAILPT